MKMCLNHATSLKNYNSLPVSAIYITPHTPNYFNFRYFYSHPYLLLNSEFKPEII